ncbi:MAG: hypothetical protein CSA21_02215 [Deltaproteobacteria bacterium]|nr:MAG: hypothetical protein CSA21_02215 [Deltaproteobacteria bacterium]
MGSSLEDYRHITRWFDGVRYCLDKAVEEYPDMPEKSMSPTQRTLLRVVERGVIRRKDEMILYAIYGIIR